MTYTVEDVDKAVLKLADDKWDDPWQDLLTEFYKHEAVKLPDIGWAVLKDSRVEAPYGPNGRDGAIYIVIAVTDESGEERHFMRQGYYASYSGGGYDGPTVEVEMGRVIVIEWKEKH